LTRLGFTAAHSALLSLVHGAFGVFAVADKCLRGAVKVPARFLILGIRDRGAGFATSVEDNDGCMPSCGSDRDIVGGRVLGCGSDGDIVAGTVLGLILVESAGVMFL